MTADPEQKAMIMAHHQRREAQNRRELLIDVAQALGEPLGDEFDTVPLNIALRAIEKAQERAFDAGHDLGRIEGMDAERSA